MEPTKTCAQCSRRRPRSEYSKNQWGKKGGLCQACLLSRNTMMQPATIQPVVPPAPVQNIVQNFVERRVDLPAEIHDNVVAENEALKKENHPQQERNNSWSQQIELLQAENKEKKERNERLKEKLASLEEKVARLEANVNRISLREAMRALENYCVYEILGSKAQMKNRRVYTLPQLQQLSERDANVRESLEKFTKLSEEDINNLIYFKELGDRFIHAE